ncbi:MAG: hypothetical protein RSA29_06670 [Clostridium sp.]|uniref:hypothetical protein n=1 Tax=Clostridium sp. TaxID=1506 RepID=UPI00303A8FCA
MLKDINSQINKVKENLASKHVLEGKLSKMKIQLEADEKELKELKSNLKKEHRDVEKLEKLSLANLIATVMKNKDEKLEKEEHEYLMAKIKYDDQSAKIALLGENIINIQDRLDILKDCESEYRVLLNKKLSIIKAQGKADERIRLAELECEIDEILRAEKEIEEADAIGRNLLWEVKSAEKSLEGAKSWGIWDIAGGDLISSMAKHGKINEAEEHFRKVSNLLRRFNKELGDVSIESISFSSTTMAFDLFFDNIFTDFSVQNKINDALNNIVALRQRVEDILNKLSNEREDLRVSILNKRREYDTFVEQL